MRQYVIDIDYAGIGLSSKLNMIGPRSIQGFCVQHIGPLRHSNHGKTLCSVRSNFGRAYWLQKNVFILIHEFGIILMSKNGVVLRTVSGWIGRLRKKLDVVISFLWR